MPGPHGLTVRTGSFVGAAKATLQPDTPTAAHLHVRDDRDTPLMVRWDAGGDSMNSGKAKEENCGPNNRAARSY